MVLLERRGCGVVGSWGWACRGQSVALWREMVFSPQPRRDSPTFSLAYSRGTPKCSIGRMMVLSSYGGEMCVRVWVGVRDGKRGAWDGLGRATTANAGCT